MIIYLTHQDSQLPFSWKSLRSADKLLYRECILSRTSMSFTSIFFFVLFAISKRKVQKKAIDFFPPSHMYNSLFSSDLQTSGMASLVKKRRNRRNSVLKATAVMLLTNKLMTKGISSFLQLTLEE